MCIRDSNQLYYPLWTGWNPADQRPHAENGGCSLAAGSGGRPSPTVVKEELQHCSFQFTGRLFSLPQAAENPRDCQGP